MLSKNQIKLIKSLSQKKIRQQLGLFTVEGVKGITEFLNSKIELEHLYCTDVIFEADTAKVTLVSQEELKRISMLKTPNMALAVFKIPREEAVPAEGLIIALDNVNDPGNLGTIIRLCDWFGVQHVVCNTSTVDCYNSKVVQASMGSLTRVNLVYTDLAKFIEETKITIFTADMHGENIYTASLPLEGIIVFGNEANGVSKAIADLIANKLTIPRFGKLKATESLNVANAVAIVLSEFKRRSIEK